MNAIALALPTLLPDPLPKLQLNPPLSQQPQPMSAQQAADLLQLACRRGQLEDASAAARVALPQAQPHSAHAAMLQALADAQPALMVAPEERHLYMLRGADGVSLGVIRLRDNGCVGNATQASAGHWQLQQGNLELSDAAGQVASRFMLCGERAGLRLYLGEQLADGQPRLLQELRCTYTRLSMLDPELVEPFVSLYGSTDMVSTALPTRATLLLGTQHTRTPQLAQALSRSAGVQIDGALMHPQGMQLAEPLLSRTAAANLHTLRAKDAPWFARMMLSRSHDAAGCNLGALQVRGFCMAPTDSPSTLGWALAEPALRIVHVVRSNLLAEFADLLAEQQDRADLPLHFEPERFGRFIVMTRRHLESLRERLRQRNADTVEVDGSRLNQATMAELLGFLTDTHTDSGQPGCEAVHISAQPVLDRFDNPSDVLLYLHTLGCSGWAGPEGQLPDAC